MTENVMNSAVEEMAAFRKDLQRLASERITKDCDSDLTNLGEDYIHSLIALKKLSRYAENYERYCSKLADKLDEIDMKLNKIGNKLYEMEES